MPNHTTPAANPEGASSPRVPQTIVIQKSAGGLGRAFVWLLLLVLIISLLANYSLVKSQSLEYLGTSDAPTETYLSGDRLASEKLAIIRVMGTIMPPFSERVIKSIKKARDDDHVKGVLLVVDSPGGTVTDSHKIYHWLKQLAEKKPVVVSMGSLAASGGYFVSMGAGPKAKIFAEPTTWTGSIGVIIPHYEVAGVAEKIGFKSAPLKTGEFKDALSPFRELTPRDKEVWDNILNQSFDLFLDVIDENRDTLDKEQVRALATGQIYTAKDAKQNGLIDEIGFQEDALEALRQTAGATNPKVVIYHYKLDLWDVLLGSAKANDPAAQWRSLVELSVPRAMYLFSWGLPVITEAN